MSTLRGRVVPVVAKLALAAGALAVFAAGLLRRLAPFPRELWLDETFHNIRLILPIGFGDMLSEIAKDQQPVLDYLLRKYVWFPILGHDERALRLPALFYSALTMLAVAGLSFRWLRRLTSPTVAALGGLAGLLWCAAHPTEIWYASEARHYSLVALFSIVWTSAYLLRPSLDTGPWLWVAAFLFANVHFFALALVLTTIPIEALVAWRRGGPRRAAIVVALATLAAGAYSLVNWRSLRFFSEHMPGARPSLEVHGPETLVLLRGFVDYAAVPLIGLGGFAALAIIGAWAAPVERRRDALFSVGRLAALWVAVVAVLFVARSKSDYQFAARYYTPFFGVAWATLLLGVRVVVERRLPRLAATTLVAASCAAIAFATISFCRATAWASLPASNFSTLQRFFDDEKARGLPVMAIVDPAYGADVLAIYWDGIGARPAPGSSLAFASFSAAHGEMTAVPDRTTTLANLRAFAAIAGHKTVLFYRFAVNTCAPTLSVQQGNGACLYTLRDPADLAAIEAAATTIGFPWPNDR